MAADTQNKHKNIIPERYKHVISQAAKEVLTANNLIVEIKPADYSSVIHHFPFAGIFEYVQNADEYLAEERNSKIMTVIKADDIGASDDDTVRNVLTRLGREPSDTHCWKVYAYELDAPNKKGLKKLLTTNILDIPANTEYHFAGFGYKDTKKIEADRFDDWVTEENERLMGQLYPISLYRNELLIDTIIRDADDGMYISEYRGGADITPNDNRIISLAAARAKSYREGSEYPRLKAEQAAGKHILPADCANLLSDETKAILANEGLRVKISELPIPMLEVEFYRIDNGDWLVGYDSEHYRKDSESFNSDLQSRITDYRSRKENKDQNLKDFLQRINAA